MISSNERLVVYGTLAPGEVNHHQLDGLSGTWMRGTVRGHLSETGWGAIYGFPGLRPNPTAPEVAIQLFISPDLPEHWDRLDAFEGADYRRQLIKVTLESETVQGYIYVVA